MHKVLIAIIMMSMTAVFATAIQAQEGTAEKDPFYPFPDRPAAATPGPHGDSDATWGRDPFNNPFAGKATERKGPASPGVRMLTGIIYGKDVRMAIFGGETYREGGKVGERKLVDIRRKSVVFKSEAGEKEEVFLEDFSVSK